MNCLNILPRPGSMFRYITLCSFYLACSVAVVYSQDKVSDDSTPPDLINIRFVNLKIGWISGRIGMFKSKDGGRSWSQVGPDLGVSRGISSDALHFLARTLWLDFVNESVGLVQRYDGLLKTTDGGETWGLLPNWEGKQNRIFDSFSFCDDKNGWALYVDGSIYHTRDGGTSWNMQTNSIEGRRLKAKSALECWVVGNKGKILRTSDGGRTWVALSIGTTEDLLDLDLSDGQSIWVLSSRAISHSTDSGRTWQLVLRAPSDRPAFRSIRFADGSRGWAVGYRGTILHTTDGGRTWSRQRSGIKADLKEISVIDGRTVWTIGDDLMLKTIDGGGTWARQKLPKK